MKLVRRHGMGALIGAILVFVAVALPGCSQKYQEPFKDAPQDGKHDSTPAKIIEMPDGFSNLASKCVGGVRYTVAYHGDHPYGAVNTLGGDNGCPK